MAGAVLLLGVGAATATGVSPASADPSAPFEGYVESLDPVSGNITGWARRANPSVWSGYEWVGLHVVVDGQDARLEVPTTPRPDVGNFGFTTGIPARYLDGQPHTLQVFAQKHADLLSPRVPIPFLDGSTSRTFTIANRAPVGFVDGGGVGTGWCQDPDTPTTPCTVRWTIYSGDPQDETSGARTEQQGTAVANKPRTDGVPGFDIPIPARYKSSNYYLTITGKDTFGNGNASTLLTNAGTGRTVTRITVG